MYAVLTVDQRDSRRNPDLVPALLDRLARHPTFRAFERTAGDEVQGILTDAATTIAIAGELVRTREWSVGLGIGAVDEPVPASPRAARGPALVAARTAVTRAKQATGGICVVGADEYRAQQLETVLWLWSDLRSRRTSRGWEVADLLRHDLSHGDVGQRLGISQSAVSQRAAAARVAEDRRTERLARELLEEQLSARRAGPARAAGVAEPAGPTGPTGPTRTAGPAERGTP